MVIGLTGGIGSGKSMVAQLFEVLGCAVFHSDQAAKEIYFDTLVKARVQELLGKESYLSETAINKPYISSKIFNDPTLLQALNSILHPAVGEKFRKFAAAHAGKVVVKESALLFEAGLQNQSDLLVVVAADDELRIERVMARDGLSRDEILLKMKSQLPQAEKIKQADVVIDNNGKDFLITQVLTIFNRAKASS